MFDLKLIKIQNIALCFIRIDGAHTAGKIKVLVVGSLVILGIELQNVLGINTDQGANMITAFRLLIPEVGDDDDLDLKESEEFEDLGNEQFLEQFDIKRINCFVHIIKFSFKAVIENPNYDFVNSESLILSFSSKVSKFGKKVNNQFQMAAGR